MNLSKIKTGDTIKNYKVLCELLGENQKAGNSKKAQLKDWERYFKYEKKGYSFTITHIYDIPLPENHNKTKYITTIQKLILDKVVQFGNNGYIFISKSDLMKELQMINQNYTFAKYKQLRLSKHMNITLEEIEDFYLTSDDLLKRNIEAALNSLRSQSLIFWTHAMTLCFIDTHAETNINNQIKATKKEQINEYGEEEVSFSSNTKVHRTYRKATKEEIELILKVERSILEKYKCESINEIFKRGLANKFYKEVREILFDSANIYWYFNSYEIIANEDYIYSKYDELLSLELEEQEREVSLNELNRDIINKINTNAEKRYNKAKSNADENNKTEMRSNDTYIPNNHLLTNTLINKDAESLRYYFK